MQNENKSIITKKIVNSAALYVYCKSYSSDTDAVTVFNDWLASCNLPLYNLKDSVMMLEKISRFLLLSRDDLRFALQHEHLLFPSSNAV